MEIYNANGSILADIEPSDDSFRYQAVMGADELTLKWESDTFTELPLGCYVVWMGGKYTLLSPEKLTMHHTRHFECTAVLSGERSRLELWRFRNNIDGRLSFTLAATPREHLQLLVDNLNLRSPGWSVGPCVGGREKLVSYDHVSCMEALSQMADTFSTEWDICDGVVSLGQVSRSDSTEPLPLSYGKGNGFLPGVGRNAESTGKPIGVLFVQGGERNICLAKYKASTLHLPALGTLRYDGTCFEGEDGFNESLSRTYVSSGDGLSLQREGRDTAGLCCEGSIDLSDIYPQRVGKVSGVVTVDEGNHFYDFTDESIPEELDFGDCLIEGEKMTVVFQSGMLSGREFEVSYHHGEEGGKAPRRFEIVPQEMDGQTMPGGDFVPAEKDEYAVFHISLPESYIHTDGKEGAEWDLMREGVRYLFAHEGQEYSFTGTLDGIWAKREWDNINGRLRLGAWVLFTDERFLSSGAKLRIVGMKDYLRRPHSPELELSGGTVQTGFSTSLLQNNAKAVTAEQRRLSTERVAARAWQDTRRTMSALEKSLLEGFSGSVSPLSVRTMQMVAGSESLQFRFVTSLGGNMSEAPCPVTWDGSSGRLVCAKSFIQHLTLEQTAISCDRERCSYRQWSVPAFDSSMDDGDKAMRWVYAVCGMYDKSRRTFGNGSFLLSGEALPFAGDGVWNLLIGILGGENAAGRVFTPLYGFTEILPGRITTDSVSTSDGRSYFNLRDGSFRLGDNLRYTVDEDGKGRLTLCGTMVQSPSGIPEVIGCYRGAFDTSATYFRGDEVTYGKDGVTCTWRYMGDNDTTGAVPSVANGWQVVAEGSLGVKGDKGDKGEDGTSVRILGASTGHYPSFASVEVPAEVAGEYALVDHNEMDDTYCCAIGISSTAPNGATVTRCSPGDGFIDKTTGHLFVAGETAFYDAGQVRGDKGERGDKGADGENGADGAFTELRFRKNGSPTDAPEISKNSPEPDGWTIEAPECGLAEYLWMASAKKNGSLGQLLSPWADPVRISGVRGDRGADGTSPAMIFRGDYDSAAQYEGTPFRLDCVRQGEACFIARTDAGTFSGVAPDDTTKWNPFGASFESVATLLLLAENANIAGFIFRDGRLESEKKDNGVPLCVLDGKEGAMRLRGTAQLSHSRVTDTRTEAADENIITLPALMTEETRHFSLGSNMKDIGKVVRLFAEEGGVGKWFILFGALSDMQYPTPGVFRGDYLSSGESMELTCFEAENGAEWIITGRNLYKGRGGYPVMLAMGRIDGNHKIEGTNTYAPKAEGFIYDGTPMERAFVIERTREGEYAVTLNCVMPDGYKVFLSGYGSNIHGSVISYGYEAEPKTDSFLMRIYDNSGRRDGTVEIMIFRADWQRHNTAF